MRKQYHFRKSPEGILVWDVHRLVELSSSLQTVQVPLDEISELDEAFWYGLDGDVPTCRSVAIHARLIMETDLSHPVILSSDGRVMDGMHRVCRAFLEGLGSIAAVRFQIDPEPDYTGVGPDDLPY